MTISEAIAARRGPGALLRVLAVLIAALAFACILGFTAAPSAYAATEAVTGNSNASGTVLVSSDGAVQYTITASASASAGTMGTVELSRVSSGRTGAFEVPDTVTSSYRNYQYQVTSLNSSTFTQASGLTSIDIPATAACTSLYLYGCTALQSITVDAAHPSLTVGSDGILYSKDGTTLVACPPNLQPGKFTVPAEVKKIGAYAFYGNSTLTSVEFASDLTGDTPAIGAYAFSGCTALESVAFPQRVAGIGAYAFSGCTKLSSVTFPTDGELYVTSTTPDAAIAQYAFSGCTALESITIPAVTSTVRSPDYYHTFEEYNPRSNFAKTSIKSVVSGYQSMTGSFFSGEPAQRAAISLHAFKDCTSLKSVVFEAGGADWGMFSYFGTEGPSSQAGAFEGCTSLQSVVYEAEQPYWADPNRSLFFGSFIDQWEKSGIDTAALYYAVDYYTTEAAAEADDARASNRLARVEYLRGTSTAAIATSDAEALKDSKYADASAYAQKDSDGVIPDAKQAAVDAGLDTAESEKVWVWKLGDTQSRREGLTDSCYAYLAPADDISTGRINADEIAALYKLCDQNLSQGSVQDTAFDPVRYAASSGGTSMYYQFVGAVSLAEGETAWFTLDSTVEEAFYSQIQVRAADGTQLGTDDYTAIFQRYDVATGTYVEAELGQADGPLLMTITPNEGSGYTGTLQEWVLVQGHAGSVLQQYTDSVTDTWKVAIRYKNNQGNRNPDVSFTSPYAVAVSSADTSSALVAAGYAGLVQAPINVTDTGNAAYGFGLSTSFYTVGVGGGMINGDLLSFSAEGFDTPSAFAVAVYEAFDGKRDGLGASAEAYPWGDTAVLVAPGSVSDVAAGAAAYAYAKRAPVFYAEDDSSVSSDTLACLKDFDKVVVIGDAAQFSDEALDALAADLGDGVAATRICGDTGSASSLSLAVAQALVAEGLADPSIVTVSDATEVGDAISALNLSGHEGGFTLVSACTADSKLVSAFLRGQRDQVDVVRLFGRDSSNTSSDTFDFYGSLCDLWSEAGYVEPVVGAGDTLVLDGVQLSIGTGNILEFTGTRLWGASELAAGTYVYGGVGYVLAEDIGPGEDPDPDPGNDPGPDPDPGEDPDPDPNSGGEDDPKPRGSLTINSPIVSGAQGTLAVSTDRSGGAPATGTIGVSVDSPVSEEDPQDAVEDSESGENPDSGENSDPTEGQAPGEGGQSASSPVAMVSLIIAALCALGAALWFALRRRSPAVEFAE